MNMAQVTDRLNEKTSLHAIQVELQQGYNLSPVEARVLARRVQELVDKQTGFSRQQGQVIYQAIAVDEPPGKALSQCRKVPVQLTIITEEDASLWAQRGPEAVRAARVRRWIYEALLQGGSLSQEDIACLLAVSTKTVKRIFAAFRHKGESLPSRGEIQDMGRGVSHKIPVVRKYVQDLSLSRISQQLGQHGVDSMARYLRHFALVMVLTDRELSPAQMESIVGTSQNLVKEYQNLYKELNTEANQRVLDRLKQTVFHATLLDQESSEQPGGSTPQEAEKRGSR